MTPLSIAVPLSRATARTIDEPGFLRAREDETKERIKVTPKNFDNPRFARVKNSAWGQQWPALAYFAILPIRSVLNGL